MSAIFREVAEDSATPVRAVEAVLDAICQFDASAFEILCKLESEIVDNVEAGRWDAVEALVVHRRMHRETRALMLAAAEKEISRLDSRVVLAELLSAHRG